jgi:hypothetical protein
MINHYGIYLINTPNTQNLPSYATNEANRALGFALLQATFTDLAQVLTLRYPLQ